MLKNRSKFILSIWLYLETRQFFDKLATKHGVDCPEPKTIARLLDKLVGEFLEPTFVNPTFLIGHPQVPLQNANAKVIKTLELFYYLKFFHFGILHYRHY